MQSEFDACVIAVDVAGVGSKERESGAVRATNSEIVENAWHPRPGLLTGGVGRVPAVCEGAGMMDSIAAKNSRS